ncbi:hypothetical protein [Mycolicibacterium cosmeticum]|uniref:hypothetical protein n=1 Tax=Mycolicibacterium cosmeticum TaxID=258533 RepID=UPI00320464CF
MVEGRCVKRCLLVFELCEVSRKHLLLVAGDVAGHSAIHGEFGPFQALAVDLCDPRVHVSEF